MLSPEAEIRRRDASGGILGEAALSLYGAAGHVAAPVAGAFLKWREKSGKEDSARRGERFGIGARMRPPGPLIWVHAASVGETLTALPLIERLTERGPTILLTTGTVTAAEIAGGRLPASAIHQFVPIDTPAAIGRFLDHWRPDLVLFAESEFWPTTFRALRRRSLPLAIVNARMSPRSFRAWRRFAPVARAVLSRPDLFLAQAEGDAERLKNLGARHVRVSGNLKFDAPPPPADETAVTRIRGDIGGRPVLLAASTHPGEEAAMIFAHAEVAKDGGRPLTILAPRHPERGEVLATEIEAAGLSLRRRSKGEHIEGGTAIYLADTIGEMGLWYRVADMAFLGGSMVPRGGQNPIEPAKLMVPVIHGAHVENFRDVYDALRKAGAAKMVADGASLAAIVRLLIREPQERVRLARAAHACVERFTGALERTLEALDPYLRNLGDHDEAAPRA